MRRPHGARRGAEYPLANEPGVLTVTSLAKTVSWKGTLLWPFTAHVFLHPTVDPQHPDPWTFERYVRELWWWVTDETFDDAVQHGVDEGCRADNEAVVVMQQSPFDVLLDELRSLTTEENQGTSPTAQDFFSAQQAVFDMLENSFAGRGFLFEQQAALDRLQQLIGVGGLQTCADESLRVWRRQVANHWVVPVWYLTIVERLDEDELVSRLQVDADEVADVVDLSRAMRTMVAAYRTSQPASANPATVAVSSRRRNVR